MHERILTFTAELDVNVRVAVLPIIDFGIVLNLFQFSSARRLQFVDSPTDQDEMSTDTYLIVRNALMEMNTTGIEVC